VDFADSTVASVDMNGCCFF